MPGPQSGPGAVSPMADSRRLGRFYLMIVLGLCALGFAGNRWWNRTGPLTWSKSPPVRLVSGPESGFRLAPFEPNDQGSARPSKTGQGVGRTNAESSTALSSTKKNSDIGTFQVDPNRASEDELCALPAIGPVLAKRIMAARSIQPFTRVEDMRRVSGIGPKTLEKIRPHLIFGEPEDGEPEDGEPKKADSRNESGG